MAKITIRGDVDQNAVTQLLACAAASGAPVAAQMADGHLGYGLSLGYHADTVRILHTLTPLGVAMAGPEVPADD